MFIAQVFSKKKSAMIGLPTNHEMKLHYFMCVMGVESDSFSWAYNKQLLTFFYIYSHSTLFIFQAVSSKNCTMNNEHSINPYSNFKLI